MRREPIMLNNFEYWNDRLNKIEYDVLTKYYTPRLLGYRLGYFASSISYAYSDGALTHDEYKSLYKRSEEIYMNVETK